LKFAARTVLGLCFAFSLAAPALAACGLNKVAQMPLLELGAHYAVMVKINDQTRPMIVDTGAEVTVLKSSLAKELDLTPDQSMANSRPVVGIGQTQAASYQNVIPSVLAFGELVYRDRSTVVAAIDDGATPEGESIGLLGDDILSQFDVEFDFPGRKLSFYRSFGCYSTFIPWTGAYSAIPFSHRRAKIAIDVLINEERTPTIVDTGNNVSFVSRDAPALWGVADSDLVNTPGRARSPLNDGQPLPVRAYTFDKLKIGDELLLKKKMGVIDVDFPQGSANLGLDFWTTRRLWISYSAALMFIAEKPETTALAYPVTEPGRTAVGADLKGAVAPK
jgi:hypothetical protein